MLLDFHLPVAFLCCLAIMLIWARSHSRFGTPLEIVPTFIYHNPWPVMNRVWHVYFTKGLEFCVVSAMQVLYVHVVKL